MTAAAYLLKFQLLPYTRSWAKLFLVIGSAVIAAALTVRFSAAAFRFGSPAFGSCALVLTGAAAWFLVQPYLSQRLRSRRAFSWVGDESLVWQDQFADTHDELPVILLAAKDVFMRSALDFHFTRAGFRVAHAASFEEAVSKMKSRPAAVLFDLNMPEENAFCCLRDIRYASRSSKIVALTRKRRPQDDGLCRRLGASDSMPKPFDPTDAVRRVVHALNHDATAEISPVTT
jgi:CheY-like chemotaxis protein